MRQFDERFITSGKRFLALAIAVIIEAVAVLHAFKMAGTPPSLQSWSKR